MADDESSFIKIRPRVLNYSIRHVYHTYVIYVQRHRSNESRRNRDVQTTSAQPEILYRTSFSPLPPPFPRTSSVSSYKANVHISGPSTAAAALGLPKNFWFLFFAPSVSF
ncbi:hypothetical protein ALC62_05382 [Cyphomyrmex costatus]|uniref:Uncharacterized protein n=1 Tax=Cyphomyrmex costatus TaxID=456900 RepID=A0A195CSM0_9HYME|nr:hypothetical protein ALC62_05382 [Cyphomyrmex costatus]